jgi:hypothetical protein
MAYAVEVVIAVSFGDDISVVMRKASFPMRPNSWFGRFWTRFKGEVIQDVPPTIDECESCREAHCTQERWLRCARRLAAEAEQQYARENTMPSATGRTDEMPGIFATDNPQDQAGEDETTASGDQRKHVSSSGDS